MKKEYHLPPREIIDLRLVTHRKALAAALSEQLGVKVRRIPMDHELVKWRSWKKMDASIRELNEKLSKATARRDRLALPKGFRSWEEFEAVCKYCDSLDLPEQGGDDEAL